MVKDYELLTVVDSSSEIQPLISQIEKLIKELKGEVRSLNEWGKHAPGYYILWGFVMLPEKVTEFRKKLRLNEEILRFMIIKT